MTNTNWKVLERFVAKALQGHRIPRGANFSRSLPDVIADSSLTIARSKGIILAECKYSISNPWVPLFEDLYEGKLLTVLGKKASLVLFELQDIHLLSDRNRYKNAHIIHKDIPGYIQNNLEQAERYVPLLINDKITQATIHSLTGVDPNQPALPIVVLAQKQRPFRLAYASTLSLEVFYNSQNDQSYRIV